jgi:hypothetical protein
MPSKDRIHAMIAPRVRGTSSCRRRSRRALAQANAKRAWLIVWATSSRSEQAMLMEKTAWSDRMLAERFATKDALAIRVDVDDDPELAVALKVRSVPAVLAFKDGEERDRLQGFREGAHLLMWLVGLGGAKTPYDEAIRAGDGDLEKDMHGRLSMA